MHDLYKSAITALSQGDREKATMLCSELLAILDETPNPIMFSDVHNVLAAIEIDKNNHDKALGMCTTCLLYTSPSPRDLSTSRMPSSA